MRIAILHRLGLVEVGQASVIIGVSSVHRKEALDACHYAIDTLKVRGLIPHPLHYLHHSPLFLGVFQARIPIWKKEWYSDGKVWKQNSEFNPQTLVAPANTPASAPPSSTPASTSASPPPKYLS